MLKRECQARERDRPSPRSPAFAAVRRRLASAKTDLLRSGFVSDEAPAVEAPGPSRANAWLAAGAIVAAVGLLGFAFTRPKPPARSRCPDETVDLAWNEDIGRRAFEDWDASASLARTVVRRDLDAWFSRWSDARAQACAAQGSPDDEPSRDSERTLACLERQRLRAEQTVQVLQEVAGPATMHAWQAVLALPPSEDCGLRQAARPAVDPDTQHRLLRADALVRLGDFEAAQSQLGSLELGEEDPLRPRLLLLRARIARHQDADDTAATALELALGDAVAHDEPALLVEIGLELCDLSSEDPSRAEEAQRWWKLASAANRRLPSAAVRQHRLMAAQARLLQRRDLPRAALSLFEVALTLAEQHYSGQHPVMIEDLGRSARAAAQLGELDAAERLAQRGLDIADASLGARHPLAIDLTHDFAQALVRFGAPQRATTWHRRALERRDAASRGPTWVALGRAHLGAGDAEAAVAAFHEASLWLTEHGPDAELALATELGLAATAQAQGQSEVAIGHLRAALTALPADASARVDVQLQLGAALADLARFDDASSVVLAATRSLETDDDDPRLGDALSALADIAMRSQRSGEALALSRRAVARLVASRGPHHPSVLVALNQLGTACLAEDRAAEAGAAFARAVVIAEAAGVPAPQQAATELAWATALWRQGDQATATSAASRAYLRLAAQGAQAIDDAGLVAWFEQRDLAVPQASLP